jgi:hypothetical protein
MDLASVTQVVNDWSVKPFVEIKSSTQTCELAFGPDYEDVFEKTWGGSEDGCKRTPKQLREYVETFDLFKKHKNRSKKCDPIDAVAPIHQTKF